MNKLIIIVIVILSTQLLHACDFCNCYLGLNPQYKKNIVGLRYHSMRYHGTHHNLSEFADANLSQSHFWEKRNILELYGQLYPVQKLQLIFSLPYIYNAEGTSSKGEDAMNGHHHGEAESDEPIKGIGDPIVIAHYQLFNKTNMDSSKLSHRLFAGGGIKFPTGKYKLGVNGNPLERMHQPGTGSWDFIASTSYLGKINRVGFNVNASYLIATINSESFQYGNKLNANAIVYYQFNVNKMQLNPSTGVFVEQAGKDWNENYYISNSGGTITYAHAALDFYFNKISINTAFQLPVSQTLNMPQPEMKFRIITGISVALN
ncbi:MAG: hypothetical protein IPO27_12940 [Bacteroidetes bacterium]|nr:hypothetical protein [Bacteroidota bacterium]